MWSGNTPVRRRSRSVGPCERWLEHRSGLATDLGTLLQPQMKKTKTLTKLTTPNDIVKSVSKYCLISQEPDTDGEIETRVVKVSKNSLSLHDANRRKKDGGRPNKMYCLV